LSLLAGLCLAGLAPSAGVASAGGGSPDSLVSSGAAVERTSGAPKAEPRIVGGTTTTASIYPWQVALVVDGSRFAGTDFERQFCGGALIHPYIVLTAAHCIAEFDPDGTPCPTVPPLGDPDGCFLDADDVDLIVGRTTLSGGDGVEQDAFQTYFSAGYDPGTSANDFGFISLDPGNVSLTRIKLAGAGERALWAARRTQRATGYGLTSESGVGSDTLKHASVPIVRDSTCGSAGIYDGAFFSDVMVCAGFLAGGVDACQGDSGGPLQAPAFGGAFRQVGVTSFGDGCARPNRPGVYTRVADQPLRGAVQSIVSQIEDLEGAPVDLDLNVVGSGARLPFPCAGVGATIAGFGRRDVLRGTNGANVIAGLAGRDVIRGRGGGDIICGGGGRDRMIGGGGRDLCIGAGGRDLVASCERTRSI